MKQAPFLIPALLRFPGSAARQDAWGRLLKISAGGGELSTAARLETGDVVLLKFELGGERLTASARVQHAYDDDDGQRVAELRWNDLVQRRDLARALVALLSKA